MRGVASSATSSFMHGAFEIRTAQMVVLAGRNGKRSAISGCPGNATSWLRRNFDVQTIYRNESYTISSAFCLYPLPFSQSQMRLGDKRASIRKKRKVDERKSSPQRSRKSRSEDLIPEDRAFGSQPGLTNSEIQPSPAWGTREFREHNGFIAEHSVLAYDEPTQPTVSEGSISSLPCVRDAILSATEALVLPVPPLRRALIDMFFDQVYHDYPVVERGDISASGSSILLQQGVFLAGSLMRHGSDSLRFSNTLYEKVKALIYLQYETNSIATLQTLCLLSCWSVKPPDKISLDGPWYWTGIASRLALQMGLHQESTYANNAHASCLRKIFWQLHNADKLQAACWGRPPSFNPAYIDVELPSLMDFGNQSLQAILFIHGTKLCMIIGEIAELQREKDHIDPQKASQLTQKLCEWVRELPAELHLYDAAGDRNQFRRAVSELFIRYFATVILLHRLHGGIDRHRHTSIPCLVASSCMIHLYEEILFRDEACYLLQMNGFLCMVASLPQINYKSRSPEKEAARQREIEVLCSVLKQMRMKYGGSEMVLRKIMKLQRQVDTSMGEQPLPETERIETPTSLTEGNFYSRLQELFPFPNTMCSQMDLLERTVDLEECFAPSFLPIDTEWFFNAELDLMDSNEMYAELPNVIYNPSLGESSMSYASTQKSALGTRFSALGTPIMTHHDARGNKFI
ncbi:hypothetical protein BDV38DRAFT_286628 [Aspergillus pseudotamarii]|uniref:Xylanolytic transcriptional activator regulatory domain-containing protein n=1 Tax=Aspergillus pseudotamarii TaxID=132259 RepID=A0A5N6SI70_ASPPS|nr:uncharacterized protein BDV38DRAFT_286628 [Aspergillus pseudotamarii]KAE8133589.1 hypothetical protein BDV38DRAFT_286628 [Aspergillus pseudotamarii]